MQKVSKACVQPVAPQVTQKPLMKRGLGSLRYAGQEAVAFELFSKVCNMGRAKVLGRGAIA